MIFRLITGFFQVIAPVPGEYVPDYDIIFICQPVGQILATVGEEISLLVKTLIKRVRPPREPNR